MAQTRRELRKTTTKTANVGTNNPVKKRTVSDGRREALLGVVVGRKGVGKTHKTLQEINRYAYQKNIPRRALLFDVNNEFRQFPTIALKDLKTWCSKGKIEVRRVSIFKAVGDGELTVNGQQIYSSPSGKMTLNEMAGALYYILENYFIGLLLIEDINKYVSDSLPNDLIGAICTQRHRGVDVIIHFQNIGRFGHPKIVGNANWLRFHKVTDTVGRHSKKFEDIVEPLSICEAMVNRRYKLAPEGETPEAKKARSFHVYWDADAEKIKGAFTKQEFTEAVESYLRINARSIVSPKLKEEDLYTGKKIYPDRKALINSLIQEKINNYYGN